MAWRLLLLLTLTAQTPAFEVVSVKPAQPGAPGTPPLSLASIFAICTMRNNRFNCAGATTRALVRMAFRTPDGIEPPMSQIVGGPDWINTLQYHITAETAPGVTLTPAQAAESLRALLEDRFKLKAHVESRPFQVYALVKARGDGSLGPQLKPSTTDCAPLPKGASTPPRLANPDRKMCYGGISRPGTILSFNATMASLASSLTNFNGEDRVVVDRTGLGGKFELDLRWSPDPTQASDLPPLVTAIQEQLGLKLEPRTEPLPAVVIDHVEQPTPD